jgi:LacI family transcriptional regulator
MVRAARPLRRSPMAYPHKSQKIAQTIEGWLADGRFKAGDRFPSDQELAREFRVNHVTVRTALKRFVDAGVLERRVGAGTIVRDPNAVGPVALVASGGVALAIPDATHSFFSEILHAVEGVVLGTGKPLLFGHTWELVPREQQVVTTWLAQGIRRMILTPASLEPAFYASLLEQGVRLVFVDRQIQGLDVPSITSRDEQGMAAVLRFLVESGHRKVVHLAGPAAIWTGRARREAFARLAAQAGLAATEAEIVQAGYFPEDGHRATLALLDRGERPDALVAANDPAAVGAIRALNERGLRVPEDVTVTGYGDTDLGRNFGLTTVRQFPERMGGEAVRLVLGTQPVGAADSLELQPELVVRASSATPRRQLRAGGV